MNKMFLRVDGIMYDGWTEASVSKSIAEASGSFTFQATSEDTASFPIARRSEIDVFLDNIIIMSGFVDIVNIIYESGSHSITISGRDKTSILIDSSVPDNRSFNPPIDLEQITNTILKRLGSTLKVVNDAPNLKKFKTVVEAKVDQTAFQFLEEYGRKANVMLTSNNDGDLVIFEPNPKRIETIILHKIGDINNNVLSADCNFDDSQRFSKYTVYTQKENSSNSIKQSGNPLFGKLSNKNEATVFGTATDPDALSVKQKIMALESSGTIEEATNRAKWEANIRRARSTSHSYTIQGFYHSKGLWEKNLIVRVVDDYATIDSDMLIDTVEYSYSVDGGAVTTLGVIAPDAYQVKAAISKPDKNTGTLTWKL